MDPEVGAALARIPFYAPVDLDAVCVEPIGGVTNRSFRVKSTLGCHVLRLAGPGTSTYIRRTTEEINARIAAEAGIGAELIHFDAGDGTMVSLWVEDAITMDIDRFRDIGALDRAGRVLRELHHCVREFSGRFDVFEEIDRYLHVVDSLGAPLPSGFDEAHHAAGSIRDALAGHEVPPRPCHGDTACENFLDTGCRMVLIDYEFSGMGDPSWDLGNLSVQGEFDSMQDRAILRSYLGTEPMAFEIGRVVLYKAMCDQLWSVWGVMQHAWDNPRRDFWAYAETRLSRSRTLMATSAFSNHLEAVERGP